jgi:hypothetical protein
VAIVGKRVIDSQFGVERQNQPPLPLRRSHALQKRNRYRDTISPELQVTLKTKR